MAVFNLNNAQNIVYIDSSKNMRYATEVWYIGESGRYKVWPGSIYLTDVKIVGPNGDLTYSVDGNGVPTYISASNVVYSGLSPNVNYSIKGTIVVTQLKDGVNVNIARYENCYVIHRTIDEHSGGYDHLAIWSSSNSYPNTKPNPITGGGSEYGIYRCDPTYVSDDSNVWISPFAQYVTKWPGTQGYTEITKMGESTIYGVRLKRTPITRQWVTDGASSVLTMSNGETITQTCKYQTSWGGPNSGSIIQTNGFTITNNNGDKISVTHDAGSLMFKCNTYSDGEYDVIVNVTAEGKTDSITRKIVVIGPKYRFFAQYGQNSINPGASITISSEKQVMVYRNTKSTNNNEDYVEISNFTLTSSDSKVVAINGNKLQPLKSGSVTITMTDDLGISKEFTCISNITAIDSVYVKVTNAGVAIGEGSVANEGNLIITFTSAHLNPYVSLQNITASFFTSSNTNTPCTVYCESIGDSVSNMSVGTSNDITVNVTDQTRRQFKFNVYSDSSKSNFIGTLTIKYL